MSTAVDKIIEDGDLQSHSEYSYNYQSGATAAIVKSGPGILGAITVNSTASGSIIAYDNASGASGSKICSLKPEISEGNYVYLAKFTSGLTVDIQGASDVTILYR